MHRFAITAPAAQTISSAVPRTSAATALGCAAIAVLWFILCRHLSNEWSVNDQYSYGWFVPFFAAFLFWLRWEDRPKGNGGLRIADRGIEARQPDKFTIRSSQFAIIATLLLLLWPIRLFEVANPDWRPLSWIHAISVVALTLLLIWRAGGRPWLRHFAFPVAFMLVAVPWITPIEAPIIQGLMTTVAAAATETLHLLGVPAQLEGNLIRVSTGLVGVNEACSGVRSLQTSIMIGLLFGELKRLTIRRRLLLLGGALAIALLANFIRAFTLVWISATDSPSAANRWHDGLGYSIVGLVFVGSMVLAAVLGRSRKDKNEDAENAPQSSHPPKPADTSIPQAAFRNSQSAIPQFAFLLALLWLFAIEAGVELWYRAHERELVTRERWTVNWPEQAPGFREIDIDEAVERTLRFDHGRQASWRTEDTPTSNTIATAMMFFFRWEPGASTILRARAHRPDICLPNVGWQQMGDFGVRSYSLGETMALPFRHFEFRREARPGIVVHAHAFFCMYEDKVQPRGAGAQFDVGRAQAGEWARHDRIRVVREGLRNPGQQVMQFILISAAELAATEAEARFAELLPQLAVVGGD